MNFVVEYVLAPIKNLICNIFTAFCNLFIKRDKSIVLFGGWYGRRFAGNSRYIFQYLSEHKEEYGLKKVIWVTREEEQYTELTNMGYEVYMMNSRKSIFYHLKAGIHCINVNINTSRATAAVREGDIIGELSLGAEHYYLNHALIVPKGNKFSEYHSLDQKTKFMIDVYNFLYKNHFIRHWLLSTGGWDEMYYLASSEYNVRNNLERNPKASQIRYIVTSYAELCPCVKYTSKEMKLVETLKQYEKVILYVPTYRRSDETGYINPVDNIQLCDYLKRKNYVWVEKLHPGARESMFAKKYDPKCCLQLSAEYEMSIIAPIADMIITDYSSTYQTGLYFKKPVLFYTPDYDGYVQKDMGLVYDYKKILETRRIDTIVELIGALTREFEENTMVGTKEYNEFRGLYFDQEMSLKKACDDLFVEKKYIRAYEMRNKE